MNKANVRVGLISQEQFDKDVKRSPEMVREYVKLAVKDYKKTGNQELFLHALMQAVRWIGVSYVARQAGLTRQGIYDALNRENANPSFSTLTAILRVLGVKMSFTVSSERPKSCAANYVGA